MSTFRFKRFSVTNEASAMKVNADGVLLGAAATLPEDCGRVLDIGTGTGTIALMVAQRLSDAGVDARIEAVDIDHPSAVEAAGNFEASPWAESLSVKETDLAEFVPDAPYDLIVSNPPYFDNSLQNPDERKTEARHSVSLSYREVLIFAAEHLSETGLVAMVLPSELEKAVLREGRSRNLPPCRILRIRTTPRKAPRRIIVEFSRDRSLSLKEELLTIQSPEYQELTGEFYL